MPSWISRARRCRSSAVAIVRISSKTSAVSRRRLCRVDLVHQRRRRRRGRATLSEDDTATPIIRLPTRSGSTTRCRGGAVAGGDDALDRLHLRPALLDHRVVGHEVLLRAHAAVAEGDQDEPFIFTNTAL